MSEFNWMPTNVQSAGPPRYSNSVLIWFSQSDVAFEFSQIYASGPAGSPPTVQSVLIDRLVMSPQHAKSFFQLFRQQIEAFESQFGEIAIVEQEPTQAAQSVEEPQTTEEDQ
ncbi:MAG: DUF3467 domain-containing protein [Gaiellaceae bacterium]